MVAWSPPAPDPTVALQVRSRKLSHEDATSWTDLGTTRAPSYVYMDVKNHREYQFRLRALDSTTWIGPVTVQIDVSDVQRIEKE